MKNNMKIVKDNENEVKDAAVQEIRQENLIKITPRFDRLTTKGVEMFKNMGDIENAKLWATDFLMTVGYDTVEVAGIMAVLQAIMDKIEADNCADHPVDFISAIQSHIFSKSVESDYAKNAYITAIQSGNFIVDNLIQSESPNQPGEQALKAAA